VSDSSPGYLRPYVAAARKHRAGFGSLLWASPTTQTARFDAFTRLYDFTGKLVLDVGCGRADFLDHLLKRKMPPAHYVGVEAVEALAQVAAAKRLKDCMIVRADFVAEPHRLLVGADVVVISGALNTLDEPAFYKTIRTAYEAATEQLIFNFLGSPAIAAAEYLHWYEPDELMTFARTLTPDVEMRDDYLHGDCTFALRKRPREAEVRVPYTE
jgi:SAM-dependent methyltransferase